MPIYKPPPAELELFPVSRQELRTKAPDVRSAIPPPRTCLPSDDVPTLPANVHPVRVAATLPPIYAPAPNETVLVKPSEVFPEMTQLVAVNEPAVCRARPAPDERAKLLLMLTLVNVAAVF